MKGKIIILFVIAAFLFINANVITGVQSIYADNSLSNKQATQILKKIDPHIVSYDFNTHEVKYDNGGYIFVTPPNGKAKNGDVTWEYFINHKGNLRGWLSEALNDVVSEKILISNKTNTNRNIKSKHGGGFSDSAYASIVQCPQENPTWCGPAATQSVLTSWNINVDQAIIESEEGAPASEDSIQNCLNNHIGFNFYRVTEFSTKKELWYMFMYDIGIKGAGGTPRAFVLLGYTKYLSGWHDKHNTCHYIAPYGYWTDPNNGIPPEEDMHYARIRYTDSANSIYGYVEPYGSEDFDPDHNRTHNLFDFTRTRDNPSVHFGAIS